MYIYLSDYTYASTKIKYFSNAVFFQELCGLEKIKLVTTRINNMNGSAMILSVFKNRLRAGLV